MNRMNICNPSLTRFAPPQFRRRVSMLALCAAFFPHAYAQEAMEAPVQDQPAEAIAPEPSAEAPMQEPAAESTAQDAAAEASSPEQAAAPETYDTVPVDPFPQQQDVAAEESTGESAQLDEIVVTATKRSQSVREIPASVNVLKGEDLAEQGARELQDFVDQVPGLQMQDVAVTSNRKIVIRGIAPDNTTNQTVGTLLGDVPLGDAIGSYTVVDPDTWDLETVEVLKGPQGTLFGASSLAGIIRYVPNAPKLGEWQGKAFFEWASTKDGDAAPTYGGALNLPIGEELAIRLSGVIERRPGVIDIENPARQEKDADEARKWSGRAMLRWEPSERFGLTALYTAQERKSDEAFFVTNFEADYTRYDAVSPSPTRRAFDLASLDMRYQFDWATLVSLSAYQTKENVYDIDSSFALAAPLGESGTKAGGAARDVDADGLIQELRLVSPDEGSWLWQFGAFYSEVSAQIYSDIYLTDGALAGPIVGLLPPEVVAAFTTERGLSLGNQLFDPLDAEEAALFGEITRELGDVKLTFGGRVYKTEVTGMSTVSGLAPFVSTGSPETKEDLQVKDDGFSPKVAATWQANDDILVYGSVSRGFQYGGVNAVAIPTPGSTTPRLYDSSTLWSYEAGVRSDWLDRTFRADLTVFYQEWSEAQVSQIAPPAEAYIDNVGEVEVKGVEASLRYLLPIDGLSLETNGAYVDSRTQEEFVDSEGNPIPPGTRMPNAPKFQGAATLNYARVVADSFATNTALQFTHAGKAFGNIQHTGRLDERNLLNFNFSVTGTELPFMPTLGVVVNNITDERRIVSATQSPETADNDAAENYTVGYTRPRTILLRLSAEFE